MKKTKQEVINDLKTTFPVDGINVFVSEENGNEHSISINNILNVEQSLKNLCNILMDWKL